MCFLIWIIARRYSSRSLPSEAYQNDSGRTDVTGWRGTKAHRLDPSPGTQAIVASRLRAVFQVGACLISHESLIQAAHQMRLTQDLHATVLASGGVYSQESTREIREPGRAEPFFPSARAGKLQLCAPRLPLHFKPRGSPG